MASVHKIVHSDGSTGWQVRWKTPDRQTRKRNFRIKPDALRYKAEVEHKRVTGTYVDTAGGRRQLNNYAPAYMAAKAASVTERTWINLDGRLRNHILPALGDYQLGAIRPEDVRLFVAELTTMKHLEAATVKPVYHLLRRILATAVVDGLIARNPCIGVELPAEHEGREMLFITPPQLTRLAGAVDPRYRALILTAGYSGLRAGELSALKVDRVLFLRRRLAVVEAHSEVRGRLVLKSTKTRRRREVPIPAALVDVLAEHVKTYPSRDGFVFTAAEGGPIYHRNFYQRHYKPAIERAELPAGLRFHDLRHTAAAIWIDQGCNEKQLSSFLGDTSRAIDRYKHLFEGHEEALMRQVDATMVAALGSSWGPGGVPVSLPVAETGA
jgi:integrase